MPADRRRQHPELPDYEELYEAALGFIAGGGNYTPAEIRQTIAQVDEIAPDHLALRLGNGTLAIRNYVAQVLRSFTLEKFHNSTGSRRKCLFIPSPQTEWRLADALSET